MTNFKLTRFPAEAIVQIKVLFPNGNSFHYKAEDSVFPTWMEVLETQEDFYDHGTILKGDLIRVRQFNANDWRKIDHSEIVFFVLKEDLMSEDGLKIRCCRIIEKVADVYVVENLYQNGRIWNIPASTIKFSFSFAELRRKELNWQKPGFPQTYDEIREYFFKEFKECHPEAYREDPPKP